MYVMRLFFRHFEKNSSPKKLKAEINSSEFPEKLMLFPEKLKILPTGLDNPKNNNTKMKQFLASTSKLQVRSKF